MDFGLASHQGIGGPGQTVVDGRVSGTPGYLAPEQAAGAEVTPKSDWYSFGVMLREGLAQHAAEDATTLEASKLQSESRSRTGLGPEVPSDLVQLCSRLLDESPGGRPAVSEVLAVLGVRADEHTSRHSLIIPRRPLGALAHGEPELRAAYRATDDEHAAVAWILGPAASGKTTLAHGFVDDLARRDDAVVLRGRCDPNEMLPYRALDGVLDALSRVLRSMTYLEARYLLPRDVDMLAALFPAFGRIGDLVPARRRRRRPLSSERMGELATRALRELLSRLSTHRPVILLLDDLQHADVESARLLASLLAPPEPPAVLVIGCARTGLRSDDEARHAFTSLLQRVPELVMRTIHLDARWSPLPSAAGQQTP
jgi:serine/threonine protein kinase